MRVLLSAIGSRGDVQPLLGLAVALRSLGHDARFCVAPNFREWVESFGFTCEPIGPDLEQLARSSARPAVPKLPMATRQRLAAQLIRDQFRVLPRAATGCDLILGFAALQIATRSVADSMGIPYVYATFCPVTLPASDHPPAKMDMHYPLWLPGLLNRVLWSSDLRRWDELFGRMLNEERAKLGLPNLRDVQHHIVTERPLLAADPVLAPAPARTDLEIVQTGAWFLPDERSLPPDLEQFLMTGEPPIYFGFGSMRESAGTGPMLVAAARALGRRAVVSRGWGNVGGFDSASDCISIGDVNFGALFPRVAAVVHHGGAGTTSAAARAGTPQVIVPHLYDQFYWARRMEQLGVGVAAPERDHASPAALTSALRRCVQGKFAERARELASRIMVDGALVAARRLLDERRIPASPRSSDSARVARRVL